MTLRKISKKRLKKLGGKMPFSSISQQARQDGVVAFSDGYKLSDNPYDRSTLQWHAWREGWMCEFEDNAND